MERIELLTKAIDKALLEKDKNYLTLGQANKLLYNRGHITEAEKKNKYLKKLLENGEIKNATQTEESPKQWRIFLSDKNLQRRKDSTKKTSKTQQRQVNLNQTEQNNNSWKWIVGGIIALIFVISQFSEDNNGTGDADPILAYNYAKDFIKDRLKSPSTAEFPGTFEKKNHVRDLGNGQYQINSWVDSQNSFGATIRSRWSCRIIFSNGKVQAEKIIIE